MTARAVTQSINMRTGFAGRPWQFARMMITTGSMIDLNTATAEQLDSIPELQGHGFEIVRYREERGRFDALRQLDEVPGLVGKWDGAETNLSIG